MINLLLFQAIKYQLEIGAQDRYIKNQIWECVAFDKPSSNPNHKGTVRFSKHLKAPTLDTIL